MLCLQNGFSEEEVAAFGQRCSDFLEQDNVECACELIFDGLVLSLRYADGALVQAAIRGDVDILNIDVTVIKDRYFGDTSWMFMVGKPSILANRLVQATYGHTRDRSLCAQ